MLEIIYFAVLAGFHPIPKGHGLSRQPIDTEIFKEFEKIYKMLGAIIREIGRKKK